MSSCYTTVSQCSIASSGISTVHSTGLILCHIYSTELQKCSFLLQQRAFVDIYIYILSKSQLPVKYAANLYSIMTQINTSDLGLTLTLLRNSYLTL